MGHRLQVDRPPEVRNRIVTGVKGFFNGCNDIGTTLPWAKEFIGLSARLG